MSDPDPGLAPRAPTRRRPWRPTTILILFLIAVIAANEAQRIMAQWQSHRERQAQLYEARASGMKLDKVIQQEDLQLELLTQHSTALDRLRYARRERTILTKPPL